MFNFISKSAPKASPSRILYFYQTHPFSSSIKSVKNAPNQHSFAVNYLINSFGFSPEKALWASKYVKFENPHKPDLVVEFFKNHGFTQTQISRLVRKFPRVLLADTQNILSPKLEFLISKGVSSTDVARIVSTCPFFVNSSLENTIIPSFVFLSNFLQSKDKAIDLIIKRHRRLSLDQLTRMNCTLATLREMGVSDSNIKYLLSHDPKIFMVSYDRFGQVVEKVEKMGFIPSRGNFVVAIRVLGAMSKSTWNKKIEVFQKWGLTEDEIFIAFKKHPWFMMKSEDKINRVMDFFDNKMGLKPLFIARNPLIISLSLEKRIVPRCAVYQALSLKGLIKTKGFSLATFLQTSETLFLKKVLSYHEEEGPQLLNLYLEKLDLAK